MTPSTRCFASLLAPPGFGKAFRKTTKSEAIDTTMSTVARFEKKEKDFLKKYDYLKTKANEQMGNFKELVGTGA